ncbi:relaxase, partial [Salmonella enterica subsp. enterica serovar Kentucky]|nr:relaxase [Salmonella enterica]EAA9957816.1 relaxase [Salmonella enterica subsp. enterica serovar Kentucky]EBL6044124.1 relaxase [Salmonella enterica subsp. enterica serovar Heidelberg]ECH1662253.1 relaxase [Salmonella enterica subsp. enterica serovar Berta]ECU0233099.1 relaxase [Salmonella enterica subsp. enterica serovar Enteritidis]
YRDYIAANSNDDASLPPPEQDKRREQPSPVLSR